MFRRLLKFSLIGLGAQIPLFLPAPFAPQWYRIGLGFIYEPWMSFAASFFSLGPAGHAGLSDAFLVGGIAAFAFYSLFVGILILGLKTLFASKDAP
jgi:hypothetical protein